MTIKQLTFPEHLSTGTRLGPSYRTVVVQTYGGSEYRSQTRLKPLHRFDVRKSLQTTADIAEFLSFFHVVRGSAFGFKFLDPYGHSTASDHVGVPAEDDCEIGSGDGTETRFQLVKTYAYGGDLLQRTLTLPVAGSVVAAVNGVTKVDGVDFSVDTSTGVLTFGTAPVVGQTVTAGCEFLVPCRIDRETERWLQLNGEQNVASMNSIGISEIPDDLPVFDLGYMGGCGAAEISMTGAVSLSRDNGRVQRFLNTSGVARNLWLPPKAEADLGGPLFVVRNSGSSTANVVIADVDTSAAILGLTTSKVAEVYLTLDSAGAREWLVVEAA